MNIKGLKLEIDEICSSTYGEIKCISIDNCGDYATVLLPYSTSELSIELDGNDIEEKIESFIINVNHTLQDMIDHLDECMLDEQ